MASRALPDLVARIRLDSSGVDSSMTSLVSSFSKANLALLGAAGGLSVIVGVTKSIVDITREHSTAEANLANAIENRDQATLKAKPPDPANVKALAQATKDVAAATAAHTHELRQLQEMQVGANANHKISQLELMHLQDQQAKVAESTKTLAGAQQELAQAQAAVNQKQASQFIDLRGMQQEIARFMQTNRDYISSQAEVTQGFTALIREGVPVKELTKEMNTALDISVGEGISLTEAVDLLQGAEAGRAVGLKRLVGLTLESIPATATMAEKLEIVRRNIDRVSAAYDGSRKNVDALTIAQDHLNTDWEAFSIKHGPAVIDTMAKIVEATDQILIPALEHASHQMDQVNTDLDKLMKNPNWETLGRFLFGDAWKGIKEVAAAPFTSVPGSAASQQYNVTQGNLNPARMGGPYTQYDILGGTRNPGQANDMHFQNEQLAAMRKANEDAANSLRKIAADSAKPRINVTSNVYSANQSDAELSAMIARNLRKIGVV